MTALSEFFDAMTPMLLGERDARAVEARLGPSPSGTARLAFYAVLARRDVASVLRQLFTATRRACDAASWRAIEDAYLATHRSTHWEPNRFGAAFPEHLRAWSDERPDVPAWLCELADYEQTRFEASTAIERVAYVRLYRHDVRVVHAGEAPTAPAQATVLAIHRATSDRLVVTTPSAAELCAIARRSGRATPPPPDVTEDAIARAARDLEARAFPSHLA